MKLYRGHLTDLLLKCKSVFIRNNPRGIQKIIIGISALVLLVIQVCIFNHSGPKNGASQRLDSILCQAMIMMVWLWLDLKMISMARERRLVVFTYIILICVSAGLVYFLFMLYSYMIIHWNWLRLLLLPIINGCESLNQIETSNRVITMILSASVLLTLRDVMKWTESVPEPSFNVFSVRELDMHRKVITRFIFSYSLYFFYLAMGHNTFLIPLSIIELIYVIAQILILAYPVWDRKEIKANTVKMLLSKIRRESINGEFISDEGLLTSLTQIMLAFHRMYAGNDGMKDKTMISTILLEFFYHLEEEYKDVKDVIPYYCFSIGLGCGMHIQPMDLVEGKACKVREVFYFFEETINFNSPAYRYLVTGLFCAILNTMSDRSGNMEKLGEKQDDAIINLCNIYNSINELGDTSFIQEVIAVSLCCVDNKIYDIFHIKLFDDSKKTSESLNNQLLFEMTKSYMEERAV